MINKLVYFTYGFALASLNRKLFTEEIEAWKYGPVVPSLYHEFKHFEENPINKLSIHYSRTRRSISKPTVDEEDKAIINILKTIDKYYGEQSEEEISKMTHHTNSPWENSYLDKEDNCKINYTDIKKHFKELLPIINFKKEKTKVETYLEKTSQDIIDRDFQPLDNKMKKYLESMVTKA